MQVEIEALYTDRHKPTKKWTQSVPNTSSVDEVIQTLIDIAQEEGPAGVVIMATYSGTALYVAADSVLATVRSHYERARRGSRVQS